MLWLRLMFRIDHASVFQIFLERVALRLAVFLEDFGLADTARLARDAARADGAVFARSLTRTTILSPDQTSSIAPTLLSTKPASSPSCRTAASVTSVSTPEAFLGQQTHRPQI